MDKSDINNLQAFSGEYLVINQAILGKFLREETSITLLKIGFFFYKCSSKLYLFFQRFPLVTSSSV